MYTSYIAVTVSVHFVQYCGNFSLFTAEFDYNSLINGDNLHPSLKTLLFQWLLLANWSKSHYEIWTYDYSTPAVKTSQTKALLSKGLPHYVTRTLHEVILSVPSQTLHLHIEQLIDELK